jgi:hypothetical protein
MDEAAQKFSAQAKAHEEALAKQQREYEERLKSYSNNFQIRMKKKFLLNVNKLVVMQGCKSIYCIR